MTSSIPDISELFNTKGRGSRNENLVWYDFIEFLLRNNHFDIANNFLNTYKSIQKKNQLDSKKYIVIGSSPFSLLKANFLASLGFNVTVIEGSNTIGGAWSLIDVLNLHNIPRATHIIMPNKKSYDFLENVFKVNLKRADPEPLEINYLNNSVDVFPKESKAFEKYAEYNGEAYELEGGTKQLVEKLKESLSNYKVSIRSDCLINKIIVSGEHENKYFKLKSINGEIFECDKLIITNGVNIKTILDDESYLFTNDLYENLSLHILIKNIKINSGFVHFNDHPFIKEFQNVSSENNDSASLLILKMKYQYWKDYKGSLTVELILKELENLNLISGDYNIVDYDFTKYLNYRVPSNLVSYIRDKQKDNICLLPFLSELDDDEYKWAAQDLSVVMSSEKFYQAMSWI